MKYTVNGAIAEAKRRGEEIRARKRRRENHVLSGTAVALCALLVVTLSLLPDSNRESGLVTSRFGATMIPAEMGGYVIVAVLSACFGVVVTLLFIRRRENREK